MIMIEIIDINTGMFQFLHKYSTDRSQGSTRLFNAGVQVWLQEVHLIL